MIFKPGFNKFENPLSAPADDSGEQSRETNPAAKREGLVKDYQTFNTLGMLFKIYRGMDPSKNIQTFMADLLRPFIDDSEGTEKLVTYTTHFNNLTNRGTEAVTGKSGFTLNNPGVATIDTIVEIIKIDPRYRDPQNFPTEDFVNHANTVLDLIKGPNQGPRWHYEESDSENPISFS